MEFKEQLWLDLYKSYQEARRHKGKKWEVVEFEIDVEKNLYDLYESLYKMTYEPLPTKVFIVEKPVKREVFAAQFRDRIVHHLVVNYIRELFEKRMINDSYSCRERKGTLYGIQRVASFIRKCSKNYQTYAYILKLDIEGFFMNINRDILWNILQEGIQKHRDELPTYLSIEHLEYYLKKIVYNDPTKNCIYRSPKEKWKDLPAHKSLFHTPDNCGLPIGNLTSQLFANIYLNEMDWYIKQNLKIKYYGRYVDDFVLIHHDKEYLMECKEKIDVYLKQERGLQLHRKKVYLQHYEKGVPFLGAFILPYRIYAGKRIKTNFYQKVQEWNKQAEQQRHLCVQRIQSQFYSYLGMIKHYNSYNLRRSILKKINPEIYRITG